MPNDPPLTSPESTVDWDPRRGLESKAWKASRRSAAGALRRLCFIGWGIVVSHVDERRAEQAGHRARQDRKRLRRALREQDRVSAKLAELHCIEALLAEATDLVGSGWMQDGWFAYVDQSGSRRVVTGCTSQVRRTVSPEQIVGTCLVGAIVQAGGGPSKAHSQLVQRTIDLTWHASFRAGHDPVRWCPPPNERAGHVTDLVRWNDVPGRGPSEVVALLDRTRSLAKAEAHRCGDPLEAV
jgi:hypothetical protein